MHIGGDIHTLTDATLQIRYFQLSKFARLGIHLHHRLVEGRNEQVTILEFK